MATEKESKMNPSDTAKNPNRPGGSAREKILRRFEKWLDEVLKNETPFEGLDLDLFSELDGKGAPPDSDVHKKDYFSTWSALTALTQEVRLQGRAFRDLSGKMETLSGIEASALKIHAEVFESLEKTQNLTDRAEGLFEDLNKKMQQEVMDRAKSEFLETFLEMRERLYTGLMSAGEAWRKMSEKRSPGWFGGDLRIQKLQTEAAEVISSLRKGYELSIERLDEMLTQHGVREISCRGARFDPETMNAVDVEQRDDMPDGTVLAVYKRGYTVENELYRPAQVKVSKMPREVGSLEKQEA